MATTAILPVLDNNGLNVRISEHFGRAPFYAAAPLGKD